MMLNHSVATSTCVEVLDIKSKIVFAEALEANTNDSCLRQNELKERKGSKGTNPWLLT